MVATFTDKKTIIVRTFPALRAGNHGSHLCSSLEAHEARQRGDAREVGLGSYADTMEGNCSTPTGGSGTWF